MVLLGFNSNRVQSKLSINENTETIRHIFTANYKCGLKYFEIDIYKEEYTRMSQDIYTRSTSHIRLSLDRLYVFEEKVVSKLLFISCISPYYTNLQHNT